MKITDKRCGWSVEGTYIETLPKGLPVPEDQMRAYFGSVPGDRHYVEHSTPAEYDRIVIQKGDGKFVIVPVHDNMTRSA